MAYLFEHCEFFRVSEKDPEVVRIWGDPGMCRVNCGNSVTRLESALALDALRSQTIVTFLFEVRRRTQVEYNDYCSVLSATRIAVMALGGLTSLSEFIVTDSQLMNVRELDKNHIIDFFRFPLSDLSVGISGKYIK